MKIPHLPPAAILLAAYAFLAQADSAEWNRFIGPEYLPKSAIAKFETKRGAEQVPNRKNSAERFQNPPYDAAGLHVFPYLAGTSGLGCNKAKVGQDGEPAGAELWTQLKSA